MIQVQLTVRDEHGTPYPLIAMLLPAKPCNGDTLLVDGHGVLEVVNVTFRANDEILCVTVKEKY